MSGPRTICAVAVLTLAGPVAFAEGFDGVCECGFRDDRPCAALTIEGETVACKETPCTLSDARPLADPAGAVQ
jgi:hypothetical protein